jgi:hypothetical protein
MLPWCCALLFSAAAALPVLVSVPNLNLLTTSLCELNLLTASLCDELNLLTTSLCELNLLSMHRPTRLVEAVASTNARAHL